MVKKNIQERSRLAKKTKPRKEARINEEEECILRKATLFLVRYVGGLLLATDIRKEPDGQCEKWILEVSLRYPTGHEGYVGDLLYDGQKFSFLTPENVRNERIQKIANDPERIRKWNEYRASTLRAGKR